MVVAVSIYMYGYMDMKILVCHSLGIVGVSSYRCIHPVLVLAVYKPAIVYVLS